MRKVFQHALSSLRRAVDFVVIALFVYMTLAVGAQVIGRYVFGFSIAEAVETATFAQIWLVLLAAGAAMRRGLHVSVDIIVAQLPKRIVRLINIPITLLCLWFLWVVFYGSFDLLELGKFQSSPVLQIPMFFPYLVLPIGAVYLALEFTLVMWSKCLSGDEADSAGRETTL
jgi:TRAP-type C4-dicarboxylate transport system permease small subunit